MNNDLEQITIARDAIRARTNTKPDVALILGSGLGGLVDEVKAEATLSFGDIPGFAPPTAPGHAGKLIVGLMGRRPIVVLQGRLHYYEGHAMQDIVFPLRVMHALGAETLIVTNAAGALDPAFAAGDLMLITDHINGMGHNPLIGPNLDTLGPRFPDMSFPYAPELLTAAREAATAEGITLREGVYVGWPGPMFETVAERRFLRLIGGDAVGMSTVPEVTAAFHAGMRILGFSAVTNAVTAGPEQQPETHEEVMAMGAIIGRRLGRIVRRVVDNLPPQR
jgi:purine-nucleoside phosphorylase